LPLSLSVTRLPKLNLADARALSYALILLIIICYAAEEGGQIEKAPECFALMVASKERAREKDLECFVVWEFQHPCVVLPRLPSGYEEAEIGLKASSETVSTRQRATVLPWLKNS